MATAATLTPAEAERARMTALREGLADCYRLATQAKTRGDTRAWEAQKARAERLVLDYIGQGYITFLWNGLTALKP